MTIRSKVHNYGHENESQWPKRFGNRKSGRSYWDEEKKCMVDGSPPRRYARHGTAPIAIMDSMPKTYHEGVGREIESREEWARADAESGCITFSNHEEVSRHAKKGAQGEIRELKQDRRKASETALGKYRANPKEVKDKVRRRREQQSESLKRNEMADYVKTELKQHGVEYDD